MPHFGRVFNDPYVNQQDQEYLNNVILGNLTAHDYPIEELPLEHPNATIEYQRELFRSNTNNGPPIYENNYYDANKKRRLLNIYQTGYSTDRPEHSEIIQDTLETYYGMRYKPNTNPSVINKKMRNFNKIRNNRFIAQKDTQIVEGESRVSRSINNKSSRQNKRMIGYRKFESTEELNRLVSKKAKCSIKSKKKCIKETKLRSHKNGQNNIQIIKNNPKGTKEIIKIKQPNDEIMYTFEQFANPKSIKDAKNHTSKLMDESGAGSVKERIITNDMNKTKKKVMDPTINQLNLTKSEDVLQYYFEGSSDTHQKRKKLYGLLSDHLQNKNDVKLNNVEFVKSEFNNKHDSDKSNHNRFDVDNFEPEADHTIQTELRNPKNEVNRDFTPKSEYDTIPSDNTIEHAMINGKVYKLDKLMTKIYLHNGKISTRDDIITKDGAQQSIHNKLHNLKMLRKNKQHVLHDKDEYSSLLPANYVSRSFSNRDAKHYDNTQDSTIARNTYNGMRKNNKNNRKNYTFSETDDKSGNFVEVIN